MVRRVGQPLGQLLDARIGQAALRIRQAVENLQGQQCVLVRFDERAEGGGALLGLLEVVAGSRDLVRGQLIDDNVGLLLDRLDQGAQLGAVQGLAGLVAQFRLGGRN